MNTAIDFPEAPPDADNSSISIGRLSVLSGPGVTFWGWEGCEDTQQKTELKLSPDRPAIIGRLEGGEVPYLDPAYRSTTVMPGTGQTVLQSNGQGRDVYVSRGHFMLRAAAGGITLVNGVPRRGGGIRPPMNWTRLIAPVSRALAPGEEYLIEQGATIVLLLPNGSHVQIDAG